jgi:hypothetical protein
MRLIVCILLITLAGMASSESASAARPIARVIKNTCHFVVINGVRKQRCQNILNEIQDFPDTVTIDSSGTVYEPTSAPPPPAAVGIPPPPRAPVVMGSSGRWTPPQQFYCYLQTDSGDFFRGCVAFGPGGCSCNDGVNVYYGNAGP